MPKKVYAEKLSDLELLDLFDKGLYYAKLDKGYIYSNITKRRLYKFNSSLGQGNTLWFTRFYYKTKYRVIPISRMIWILGNRMAIPEGFEVHHYDTNPNNNAFDNLFAVSKIDHRKWHIILNQQPF